MFNSIAVILSLLIAAAWVYSIFARSRFLIHMLQLEGYRNNNFSKWIKDFSKRAYPQHLHVGTFLAIFTAILSGILYSNFGSEEVYYVGIILWSLFIIYGGVTKKEKSKVELNITDRVRRLIRTHILVNLVIAILIIVIVGKVICSMIIGTDYTVAIVLAVSAIAIFLQPRILMLSNKINKPIEENINKKYFVQAQEKVRSIDGLEIVGITGSYGKTSTKFLTATILSEKFKTLKTPESYNTPMGVSLVINRDLDPSYEVFVAEMGARNIGDIAEMGDLVGHNIGIITSVGPAHLETFKNIENIMNTKYEIIEKLPEDGIAIFNYDNKYVKELSDRTKKFKKINYGIKEKDVDVYAKDIKVSATGSEFILGTKDGKEVECSSKLLGEHNILNLLAGASAGLALGMSLEEIARGISKVEPVPHRLQLMNLGTGIIIIDDAFNSNPDGAKAALDVISKFEGGRKIVITPGMIELGDSEFEENKEFGRNIAKTCDFAILVGEDRAVPIKAGIEEARFPKESIFIARNLDRATEILGQLARPGDVVLFENDLPDNYNEK